MEEGPIRQSPLNAIWEGSGNVIALDTLRALAREPEARVASPSASLCCSPPQQ